MDIPDRWKALEPIFLRLQELFRRDENSRFQIIMKPAENYEWII